MNLIINELHDESYKSLPPTTNINKENIPINLGQTKTKRDDFLDKKIIQSTIKFDQNIANIKNKDYIKRLVELDINHTMQKVDDSNIAHITLSLLNNKKTESNNLNDISIRDENPNQTVIEHSVNTSQNNTFLQREYENEEFIHFSSHDIDK